MTLVIFGCGYTGMRVAQRFLARGSRVIATTRSSERLAKLSAMGAEAIQLNLEDNPDTSFVPQQSTLLYSIPAVDGNFVSSLGSRPSRIVHLSTTGVYGAAPEVDHTTPVAPRQEREVERLRQEELISSGSWPTLTLRAAAIYGPGRGVHVSLARGDFRLSGDGSNYTSRIHVDDLAALTEAALLSGLTGAFPVADDEPCRSIDITRFCAAILDLPVLDSLPTAELHHTRQANRRVNGREIRRLLGVNLQYPSYRVGIPASLTKIAEISGTPTRTA